MYLIGLHLIDLHLTDLHLTGLHLTGLHLTGMHLTGMHFTGLYLTGLHLTGIHILQACISRRRVPELYPRQISRLIVSPDTSGPQSWTQSPVALPMLSR
jgi:hypothetical protein